MESPRPEQSISFTSKWDRIAGRVWGGLGLSELRLRRISALLHRLFGPVIVQPPVAKIRGNWETLVRADIMQFLESWRPHINGRVLDVGGGTWSYPRELLAAQCDYVLMDCLKHPNVDVVADIHQLTDTFTPNSFDFLLCCDVLEHVANPFRAAEQMYEVLKPKGRLLLTTPFNYLIHGIDDVPDLWRITDRGLERVLSSFVDIQIEAKGEAAFPRSYLVVATK